MSALRESAGPMGSPPAPPEAPEALCATPPPPPAPDPPRLRQGQAVVRGRLAPGERRFRERDVLPEGQPPGEPDVWSLWRDGLRREDVLAFLTSTFFHAAAVLSLALLNFTIKPPSQFVALVASVRQTAEPLETTRQTFVEPELESAPAAILSAHRALGLDPTLPAIGAPGALASTAASTAESTNAVDLQASAFERGSLLEANALLEKFVGMGPPPGGVVGRLGSAKAGLLKAGGGSRESEAAVQRGLRWLAAHQYPDGSWHFDHRNAECHGQCRNQGTFPATTGATGLALLAFLGAGQTQTQGEHQALVQRGFYYLASRMKLTALGGDLQETSMYAQGVATLAFCEAYAMTGDRSLRGYAQRGIDFIVHAQDKRGGGWRYTPGQPGDTTVFGWQLMALKSARLGRLDVPSPTIDLASKYLDSVQTDNGSAYGYTFPERDQTNTAIGLLCRMYLGWRPERPAISHGVNFLERWGPHRTNMYYNYYATQVMRHYGGSPWTRWNKQLRDNLIAAQATGGHELGSWFFPDKHGDAGGRLYNTAMAIMTLEVYYRYLPLYGERSTIGKMR